MSGERYGEVKVELADAAKLIQQAIDQPGHEIETWEEAADAIKALRRERDEASAALDRVQTLADEWHKRAFDGPWSSDYAESIRRAIKGEQ